MGEGCEAWIVGNEDANNDVRAAITHSAQAVLR